MPSASDLLKKHAKRVPESAASSPRMQRKGPTRPWQENLEQYSEPEEKLENSNSLEVGYNQKILSEQEIEPLANDKEGLNSTSSTSLTGQENAAVIENKMIPELDRRIFVEEKVKINRPLSRSVEATKNDGGWYLDGEDKALKSELSQAALSYTTLIKEFGFDFAMKVLLVRELANSEGLIHCSQQTMANHLDMSLKSVKRLFDDLCDRKAIELYSESDPKTKAPRQYKVLWK